VLPEAFASDPERLARFKREGKTLAQLNHPNIATIHGVERADGIYALVMELVEGPTLADRIAQGPLPVKEALPIAKQIAEALEAAHEQGIIHRDLKPANIKVRPDGGAKVLDFGLAKALEPVTVSPDQTELPTISSPAMTQRGVILGTAAYMSPEQACGKAVDKRSDIWAFGCVLFEMLTGQRAFPGTTLSDTIARILECDPDWARLPGTTPHAVQQLLRRSLEKDPRRRLRDIGDTRFDLEDSASAPAPLEPRTNPLGGITRREAIGTLVGATIGAAAFGGVTISRSRDTTPRQLTRFTPQVPEGMFSASAPASLFRPTAHTWRAIPDRRAGCSFEHCAISNSSRLRVS
jgi:serine/threonine protein kinase